MMAYSRPNISSLHPIYLGLKRDNVEIHLNSTLDSPHEAGKSSISIFTNEVDELYKFCLKKGVDISIKLGDYPYGLRDFGLKEIDGGIMNI